MRKFDTILEKFDSKLWNYHIKVPDDIAESFIEGKDKRVVCQLNGKHSYQAAIMRMQDAYFILVNKQVRTKLKLEPGDLLHVSLTKDSSEYGLEMPDAFQTLLDQDPEAQKVFDSLSPGKKRGMIFIVSSVKNVDSRIKRAMAIAEHLKESGGELDYKRINHLIKEYNHKF